MTLHDDVLDVADALTQPRQHRERVRTWDHSRNPVWRDHVTIQPGLLAQLYQSVVPAGQTSGSAVVPGSRPPLALEALSRHVAIVAAVNRWRWSLDLPLRPTVEANLRQVVAATASLDDDVARALLAEMRQWRRWCAVLTGWEQLYQPAGVPCPVADCARVNTLRINLTSKTAMCRACLTSWSDEDGGVRVLANYIRNAADLRTLDTSPS